MNCRGARSAISSVCNSFWSADPAAGAAVGGDPDGMGAEPGSRDAIAILLSTCVIVRSFIPPGSR